MGISRQDALRLSSRELSGEFVKSKGKDGVAGSEIMRRVVDLAGLDPNDWFARPLKSRNGQDIRNQGEIVRVENYLSEVAIKHPGAVRGILTFLNADTTDPSFPTEQSAMAEMIKERT